MSPYRTERMNWKLACLYLIVGATQFATGNWQFATRRAKINSKVRHPHTHNSARSLTLLLTLLYHHRPQQHSLFIIPFLLSDEAGSVVVLKNVTL